MGKVLLTLITSTSIPMTLRMNCVTGIPKRNSLSSLFPPVATHQSHLLCTISADLPLLIPCLLTTTALFLSATSTETSLRLYSPKIQIWFPKAIVHPFLLLHQCYFLGILIWVWAWSGHLKWSWRGVSTGKLILSLKDLSEPQGRFWGLSLSLPPS